VGFLKVGREESELGLFGDGASSGQETRNMSRAHPERQGATGGTGDGMERGRVPRTKIMVGNRSAPPDFRSRIPSVLTAYVTLKNF